MRFRDRDGNIVDGVFHVHQTPQNVAYTGTAGTVTNALATTTTAVRITVTSNAFVEFVSGSDVATAATGFFVMANVPIIAPVPPGKTKVSAIQVSAGGSLYITELNL